MLPPSTKKRARILLRTQSPLFLPPFPPLSFLLALDTKDRAFNSATEDSHIQKPKVTLPGLPPEDYDGDDDDDDDGRTTLEGAGEEASKNRYVT